MQKYDKRKLWAIVELAYSEGIGACRLSRMIGCSRDYVRFIARDLRLPKLAPKRKGPAPSDALLQMMRSTMLIKKVEE